MTRSTCLSYCLALGLLHSCLGTAHAQTAPRSWPALQKVDDRSKIAPRPKDRLICFTLYTVQDGILKLSTQFYPLEPEDPHTATLEVRRGDDDVWEQIAQAEIHPIGWTATFRLEDWDATKTVPFRVRHPLGSVYEGTIRRDPTDMRVVVAAAFTGNSPGPGGGKISKRDVVDSVLEIDPDVLFFTGDQVYPHVTHTENWLAFGEIFGDLTRGRPTVCLPDDHDVGQPNLWGGGGRPVPTDVDGGYTRPPEYVKLAERQQTSHLPDPYDPTPIEQGIGVYYTSLNIGGVDFALIEDRKFKSGCADLKIVERGLGPRPDHIDNKDYDPASLNVPGKEMLGQRQHDFLDAWSRDWDGAVMKAVVSQTALAMTSTHNGPKKTFYYCDLDANGWPQSARDEAVRALRRAGAFHICGDQHLSTMGQYGIEEFGDAPWWFCVPSIANLFPRWWEPRQQPVHKLDGPLDYLGDYLDGFGNKITVYGHTNPYPQNREPAELLDRMPGFGVVRFDKQTRDITIECWPRMVDVTDPQQQYTGWPRTISQFDNLGQGTAYLPTLEINGATDPVVEVTDEADGSVQYTVRIAGNKFRPPVYREGKYRVTIRDGERTKMIEGVESLPAEKADTLKVDLAGKSFRVGAIVLKWVRGDKEANLRRAEPLIREAAAHQAELVVTTECFLDGYAIADKSIPLDEYRALGEQIPGGPYFGRLARLADELDIHLVAGMLEADGEARFNTAILLGPDGKLLGKYRKQKLGHELVRNTPGDRPGVFDTPFGRMGLIICADRTETDLVGRYREAGADFLVCPSGGMFGPAKNDPIVQARSRETGLPIVFIHPAEFLATGPDGKIAARTLLGDRLLVAPEEIKTEADSNRVLYFDLRLDKP